MAEKLVASNRRARHDYHIVETVEAGLVLTGSEIKSVRGGRVSLQEAFATIEGGEAWLVNAHIAAYEHAGYAATIPGGGGSSCFTAVRSSSSPSTCRPRA